MTHTYHGFTKLSHVVLFAVIFFSLIAVRSYAYTVTNLNAAYQSGQVFLTWTNPNVTNLQYNVYRSSSPILLESQLSSENFLGFVRDSSSKNIFWSQQSNENVFFKIQDNGSPLPASTGVYVATCTTNLAFYYAVTVTKLSNNNEDKTIVTGQNVLATPVIEIVAKPQPVWQDSVILHSGEVKQHYVQYGDNLDAPLYPAMNSTGSYGFNFYIVRRGLAEKYPLFVVCEGFGADANKNVSLDSVYTNCYILGIYDWLPIPTDNGTDGDNTYFCCYHEHFNIYSNQNPVPTSGVIRTYPQNRYQENIKWLKKKFPIDTTRLYIKGTSANGFGALLTAAIFPEEFAAVYAVVEPMSVGAGSNTTKQLWGENDSHLNSDILNWKNGDSLAFTKLTALQKMLDINEQRGMPVIFDIHGKQDKTVGWTSGRIQWMDSLQSNHIGGAWYWDQRVHNGDGKNFDNSETQPDYFRYATNKSYPAFSNCSINQDPGNGKKNSGTDYGGINGYLDFDNDIIDESCKYSINLFVKDFYVGGILDPEQYSTCTADVTFRRLQNFQPSIGATIRWKNLDANNIKIQSGAFVYNGDLITIPGITINKTGNIIKLRIKGCGNRTAEDDDDWMTSTSAYFSRTPNGYSIHLNAANEDNVELHLYDLEGRVAWENKVHLTVGDNAIDIPFRARGLFVFQMKGKLNSITEKLFF